MRFIYTKSHNNKAIEAPVGIGGASRRRPTTMPPDRATTNSLRGGVALAQQLVELLVGQLAK